MTAKRPYEPSPKARWLALCYLTVLQENSFPSITSVGWWCQFELTSNSTASGIEALLLGCADCAGSTGYGVLQGWTHANDLVPLPSSAFPHLVALGSVDYEDEKEITLWEAARQIQAGLPSGFLFF